MCFIFIYCFIYFYKIWIPSRLILKVKELNNNIINKIINDYRSNIISRILRGSARWSIASKQDKSPLISVLHGNYGAAYLWALKEVFNDNEISFAIGNNFDIIDFQKRVTDIQDFATKRMVSLCKEYASGIEDKILSTIAGNS
jgi:hypothetical protein